jgi:hypothetical protein
MELNRSNSTIELDSDAEGPESGNTDLISSFLESETFLDQEGEGKEPVDSDRDREREDCDEPATEKPVVKEEEEEEEDGEETLNFDEPESEENVTYNTETNQLKAASFAKLVCKLTSSTTEIGTSLPRVSSPSSLLVSPTPYPTFRYHRFFVDVSIFFYPLSVTQRSFSKVLQLRFDPRKYTQTCLAQVRKNNPRGAHFFLKKVA